MQYVFVCLCIVNTHTHISKYIYIYIYIVLKEKKFNFNITHFLSGNYRSRNSIIEIKCCSKNTNIGQNIKKVLNIFFLFSLSACVSHCLFNCPINLCKIFEIHLNISINPRNFINSCLRDLGPRDNVQIMVGPRGIIEAA